MICRRSFALGTIAAALLWSTRVAGAPPPGRVYRIGVLDPNPDAFTVEWNEFVAELARRGYVEGRNVVLERRFGEELRPDLLTQYARELVALKVDLLYAAHGTQSALAAKNATKTIPIVFYSSADPVGLGLVASLSRPGGNLTGSSISGTVISTKRLQYLVEAIGRSNLRIVQLDLRGTRSLPWFSQSAAAITAATAQLGVKFEYVEVDSIAEIERVVKRLAQEGVDAVIFEPFPVFKKDFPHIARLLIDNRLPSIGDPRAGFLMYYEPDALHLARKAAEYADKILRGASPADLPVEQASISRLVINGKTARAIGLQLPPSILQRADEVIQ